MKLSKSEVDYYAECIKHHMIEKSIYVLESDQIRNIIEYDNLELVKKYLSEGPVGVFVKSAVKKAAKKILPIGTKRLKNIAVRVKWRGYHIDKKLGILARKLDDAIKLGDREFIQKARNEYFSMVKIKDQKENLLSNLYSKIDSNIDKLRAALTGEIFAGAGALKMYNDSKKQMEQNKSAMMNIGKTPEQVEKSIKAGNKYKEAFKSYLSASREIVLKYLSSKGVSDTSSKALVSALFFALSAIVTIGSLFIIQKLTPIVMKLFSTLKSIFSGKKATNVEKEAQTSKSIVKKMVSETNKK